MRFKKFCLVLIVFAIYMILLPGSDCSASSVLHVSVDEMVSQCQLVFEGHVLASEARLKDNGQIHTLVTFEITEIIKGEYPDHTITLSFLGGTVGDISMGVSDMEFPQDGERGIYFVESVDREQVHPFYGWSQGHFLVETDETGVERLMTRGKQPVTAVDVGVATAQAAPGQPPEVTFGGGVARGLVIGQGGERGQGMTTQEFKQVLRDKIGRVK